MLLNYMERTELSDTSWIDTCKLPRERLVSSEKFEELWALHPDTFSKLRILGKQVDFPRWNQSYGKDYYFSGNNHKAVKVPDIVQNLLDWANELGYGIFNQVLVNWYADGQHYIGKHSDDERQLAKNSTIMSISLGETRKFRIRDKADNSIVLDLDLEDGDCVLMGGTMQKEYTHEIVKVLGEKGKRLGRRINVTFRQFA